MKITKPTNFNGQELREELRSASVEISDDRFSIKLLDDTLIIDIESKDEAKAKIVVQAHNGTIIAREPTIADKLASVGLSIEDLKAALA